MNTIPLDSTGQQERVRRFFDTAESWKGKMYSDREDRFNRAMIRRKEYAIDMLRNISDLSRGTSLDIGCGCGVYSKELSALGFTAYGVDVSKEMIEECRKTLQVPAAEFDSRFMTADSERLPFESESFDLVLSVGVFGYLLEDEKAMREAVRVLKPGGYFFLSVQNIMSLSNVDYALRMQVRNLFRGVSFRTLTALPVPWVMSHTSTHLFYKSYFPRKLKQMVSRYGFSVIDEMSLGYEFRAARRLGLLSNATLVALEERLERFARRFPVAPLKYAGDTFSVLFKKH